MGIQSMRVHVEADDERAIAFYHKQGFKFTGHLMKKAV
jgi:ribosomal protein S18 acetylase RimI-like enzyme